MVNVTPSGAGVTGPVLYVGGTIVGNAANGFLLYNNNGVLGAVASSSIAVALTVGSTAVSGGTASGVLWNNAGVLASGPLLTSATGVLLAPDGAVSAPAYAFANETNTGWLRYGGSLYLSRSGVRKWRIFGGTLTISSDAAVAWTDSTDAASTADLSLSRAAARNLRLGGPDVASPGAQTFSVPSVVAGTSNTAGASLTITGSRGTGTGVGGSIVFQTAPAGGSGTAVNALATIFSLNTTAAVVASGKNFQLGNAATTGLVAGALAAATDASIVLYDSTGQAYRVPCII